MPAGIWLFFCFMSLLPFPLRAAGSDQPAEFLYSVKKDGKYGYINQTGQMIIEPQYESAAAFSEGLALVRVLGKYGYADMMGNLVIPFQYTLAASFSEGLARVQTTADAKMGYIDSTGKMAFPPAYAQADDFHEGLARVGANKKYGFINKKGELIIPLQYDTAQGFSQGLALVKKGADYFYIDAKGKKVLDPDCRSAGSFREGLAYFGDGQKMGYLDQKGKIVIAPQFEEARNFSQGLAAVKLNQLWGYIDKTGQWVIAPQFDSAVPEFREGLAAVKVNGQNGYIDRAGRLVIRPQYKSSGSFSNGLAWCSLADETGYSYINQEGRYIWTETNVISGLRAMDFETPQAGFQQESPWTAQNGWLTFSSNTGDSSFNNVYPDRIYDSFSYGAEVRWDGGAEDSGYGLVFLYTDPDNYYRFDITGNRSFRVSKQSNGKWTDIYPWKKCTQIEAGNLLKVVYWPGTVQCYINGVLVAHIQEPDASQIHGYAQVALCSDSGVQCSFNHIEIGELSAEEKESYSQAPLEQKIWDFSEDDGVFKTNSTWTIVNGRLNFTGGEKGLSYNNVPAAKYLPDFTLTVDGLWTGGDTGYGYGVIFRYTDSQNYYDFKVSPKGYYRLAKRSHDITTELVKWMKNDKITARFNTIKIICREANIKCYVNDTLVVNLDDEQPDGAAGRPTDYVSLGVTSNGAISCTFDNFSVVENTLIWRDKP